MCVSVFGGEGGGGVQVKGGISSTVSIFHVGIKTT